MNKKILFLIQGFKTPSSRIRILQYERYFAKRGFSWEIMQCPKSLFKRIPLLLKLKDFDLIYIQKKLFHLWELNWLVHLKKKIIFDFDDSIMFFKDIPSMSDEKERPSHNIRYKKTINISNWVIAGNNFLLEQVLPYHQRVSVIPSSIDVRYYNHQGNKKRSNNSVIIGWIGTGTNLVYLQDIMPALKRLLSINPEIALKIISDDFIDFDGLPVIKKRWSLEDELEDIQSLDIGIMPLRDDVWSKGKCGFKAIQYMGSGIPVVSSPVGSNCEIIKNGENGFIAAQENEWFSILRRLIEDSALRKTIGERGRDEVMKRYSIDVNGPRLCDIISNLL